jgi:hypothetical protein
MWELGASGGKRSFGLRTASRPETEPKELVNVRKGSPGADCVLGPVTRVQRGVIKE